MLTTPDGTVRLPTECDVVCDPRRVLVVDDNVDYAEGIALLLEASGYRVKVAHNGHDALHWAVEFRPDVVLLDIGLPEMDGYEIARRLRQVAVLVGLRVVAVSGYRAEAEDTRSRGACFDDYLLKPVLLPVLVACLRC